MVPPCPCVCPHNNFLTKWWIFAKAFQATQPVYLPVFYSHNSHLSAVRTCEVGVTLAQLVVYYSQNMEFRVMLHLRNTWTFC
jgi:hypothetical protein